MSIESWLEGAASRRSERWIARVRLFLENNATEEPGGVVFFGDSITQGFPLEQHFPNTNVINRGIGGDSVMGLLERLNLSVVALKPRKLFVLIGVNDVFHVKLTGEQLQYQHRALIAALVGQLPGTEIFMQSILPIGDEWAMHQPAVQFANEALPESCAMFGVNFVDLRPAFAKENGGLKPELTDDGVHLTEAGYALWTSEIRSLVEG